MLKYGRPSTVGVRALKRAPVRLLKVWNVTAVVPRKPLSVQLAVRSVDRQLADGEVGQEGDFSGNGGAFVNDSH